MVEPPTLGLDGTGLIEAGILTPEAAGDLYDAMVADTVRAVESSGGDLLVNYRDPESLSNSLETVDPATHARSIVESAMEDPDDARFEVQVGSTPSARAGNTATHLLREEAVDTVAIVDPRVPTFDRPVLDNAAMKLRRHEVVVAPATGGRIGYLGLSAPIDFEGLLDPPALERVVDRAHDENLAVDFLPLHAYAGSVDGLRTLTSLSRARHAAGLRYPRETVATLDRLGVAVDGTAI